MLIVREVSNWSSSLDLNHIYLLNDSMTKVYGYIRNRDLAPILYDGPRDFYKKYREFKVLEKISEN